MIPLILTSSLSLSFSRLSLSLSIVPLSSLFLLSLPHLPPSSPSLPSRPKDPLFSECLVYYIPQGTVFAGSKEADSDILLSGPDIIGR